VDGSGVLAPSFILSGADEPQDRPAVSFDGQDYLALFQDLRNRTFFIDTRSDVFGAHLVPDGQVIDPNGIGFFTGSLSEIDPAVSGRDGQILIAAAVYRQDVAAYRIGLQTSGDGPPPEPAYEIYLPLIGR
jgi:hypothetical protein